jgi:hypothetical protein
MTRFLGWMSEEQTTAEADRGGMTTKEKEQGNGNDCFVQMGDIVASNRSRR